MSSPDALLASTPPESTLHVPESRVRQQLPVSEPPVPVYVIATAARASTRLA